ncbi:MAG: hypothetical protein SFX72_04325 [Isosphaeraceae bacterium]|nr:hypothetical protein [Isosphaeraceae bacterium]
MLCSLVFWTILIAQAPERGETLATARTVEVRGVYGGSPRQILDRGRTLADFGINAVWIGSGGLSQPEIDKLHALGAKVYAEFNSMHDAGFLKSHPDAAPIGEDGEVCPAPDGWQGICPTHPEYRRARMDAFRKALADFTIDGIWLDYHHAHASWEQAEPNMPNTCFCGRCLTKFQVDTKTPLPKLPTPLLAKRLLGPLKEKWVAWRLGIFTDWVREYRAILDEVRPKALLGTFHCPWAPGDFDGAIREKLAIDLVAQAKYVDVFSIMPYHARFGHASDPAWISRSTAELGKLLGVEGKPGERVKIWPIVQLADWGEPVPVEQVPLVLDHGTRPPATGVMIFHWGGVAQRWERAEAMGEFYRRAMSKAP